MSIDELSDTELDELGATVVNELRRRALLRHDPASVVDEAFASCFDSRHNPADPEIVGGLLVCCGSLKGRPQGHRCSFTTANDRWCWDQPYVYDELRRVDETTLLTATLLVAAPGLVVSQIDSVADQGGHRRKSASSWRITRGRLDPVPTPSRVPEDHRRN